jgi:ArsR family transcriptional regulator
MNSFEQQTKTNIAMLTKKSKKDKPLTLANVIHENKLYTATGHLRAITHDLRLKILDYIDKHPSTSVNNIYNSLGLEQSITSQHLRILRNSELVASKRDGKQILYTVNYKRLQKLTLALRNYIN